MADEAPTGSPYTPLLFIVGLLVALGVLWWVRGGPNLNQQTTSSTATTTPQTQY